MVYIYVASKINIKLILILNIKMNIKVYMTSKFIEL